MQISDDLYQDLPILNIVNRPNNGALDATLQTPFSELRVAEEDNRLGRDVESAETRGDP